MLSGRSPFLGSHIKSDNSSSKTNNDDSVASIIRRIKHGDFRMDHQEAWKYVSSAAKSITKGLLTVEVKKRLTIDSLLASNWINFATSNNNNPPSLLLTPMVLNEPATSLVIDRHLKQTFNAYHTVAREASYNSSIHSGNSSIQSSPASSISSSGAVKAASEVVTKTTQDYLSSQFLNTSQVSISPFEAFSGVSYQLMPSFFNGGQVAASLASTASTASGVSITKMGPMTRSRKRKMQDNISSVSITPLASNCSSAVSTASAASKVEIVTVTKRERTMDYFPQAASSEANGMQYCATARAVVVTPAASTWTPTASAASAASNTASRSVTITID